MIEVEPEFYPQANEPLSPLEKIIYVDIEVLIEQPAKPAKEPKLIIREVDRVIEIQGQPKPEIPPPPPLENIIFRDTIVDIEPPTMPENMSYHESFRPYMGLNVLNSQADDLNYSKYIQSKLDDTILGSVKQPQMNYINLEQKFNEFMAECKGDENMISLFEMMNCEARDKGGENWANNVPPLPQTMPPYIENDVNILDSLIDHSVYGYGGPGDDKHHRYTRSLAGGIPYGMFQGPTHVRNSSVDRLMNSTSGDHTKGYWDSSNLPVRPFTTRGAGQPSYFDGMGWMGGQGQFEDNIVPIPENLDFFAEKNMARGHYRSDTSPGRRKIPTASNTSNSKSKGTNIPGLQLGGRWK